MRVVELYGRFVGKCPPRDVLSDRWSRADETYARKNPKRVYYVSIEFLIGRSLANNIMNLVLDPLVEQTFDEKGPLWTELLDEEPDAGLGNGGLGRLAACFLDSMATLQLPAMGYGLRYEHGMFHQSFRDGWQEERPDNWLDWPDPWEVVRPSESVEVRFGCSFELRDGDLRLIPQRPATLIGVPYDRPVVGYGGHTINTLRLWSGTAARAFDFQEFSGGDFVAAMAEGLAAGLPTQVLYPNDATLRGRGLRLVQEYFLVACSLADLVRRFRASNTDCRVSGGFIAFARVGGLRLDDIVGLQMPFIKRVRRPGEPRRAATVLLQEPSTLRGVLLLGFDTRLSYALH